MTRLRRCWQERRSLVAPLIVPELEAPDVKLKMPSVRSPLHHGAQPSTPSGWGTRPQVRDRTAWERTPWRGRSGGVGGVEAVSGRRAMIRKVNEMRPLARIGYRRWTGQLLIVVALSSLGCARGIGPPRP